MSNSISSRPLAGEGIVSDECDYDDTGEDRDMVLSKEDFEMLHALHRFVPLPALSSNILRILCDDDLQVAHEDDADDDETLTSLAATSDNDDSHEDKRRDSDLRVITSMARVSLSSSSCELTSAAIPKHSPLTRRLSKTPIKPRIEINLAPSPQYQKKLQQQQQQVPEHVNNNELDPSYEDSVGTRPRTTFRAATRELRTE